MNMIIKKQNTFAAMASDALNQNDGIVADAIDMLKTALLDNHDLLRAIISEVVQSAVTHKTHRAHIDGRAQIIRRATSTRVGVKALANGIAHTLLDFPMMDGSPLWQADHGKVSAMIDHYRKSEEGARHKANWLSSIVKMIPAQGIVGDVLDADTAKQLWEKAQ